MRGAGPRVEWMPWSPSEFGFFATGGRSHLDNAGGLGYNGAL